MNAYPLSRLDRPFPDNRRQIAPSRAGRLGSAGVWTTGFLQIILGLAIMLTTLSVGRPAAAEQPSVTVFAAVSTTDAITSINALCEEKGLGRVAVSFAASSTLAKQIENGAPANLFLSADNKWMDYLALRNMIEPSSRRDLLSNRIVLITSAAGPLEPFHLTREFALAAMLGRDRLAMGDPSHVPAGVYGQQALSALDLWTSVADKIAPARDVRSALMLVERGEVPLGLVYSTDAAVCAKVRVVAVFPADCHPPITYPVALVKGRNTAAAGSYLEFLTGPQGRKVFETYGFIVR